MKLLTQSQQLFHYLQASFSPPPPEYEHLREQWDKTTKKLLFKDQDGTKQIIQTNLEIAAVLPSQNVLRCNSLVQISTQF